MSEAGSDTVVTAPRVLLKHALPPCTDALPCRYNRPPHSPPGPSEADELLRQYVQEALSAKASGGSTKLYDQ